MAYKLTYYKVIGNTRINIYEKDGIQATQEIGAVVQGLNLEIQGQQSDVTAPIVKTSLNMVLCDAPDLEPGKKCGGWDVFYTPDATKWKVEVVTINEDDSADVEWSGFITPDSYMEELTYRGSVNIIARDNIGHLQDMDFTEEGDAVGMMTVKEILRTAWAKIEQPMVLTFDDYEDLMWLQSEGVKAYDASINVSAFAGKTWYDVVEAVLDSFGLCMRYVGLNEVAVTPLRYLSLAGNVVASSTRRIIPTFEAGAIRELTPACRVIVETAEYESAGVSAKPITPNDFIGTEGVYSFLEEGESVPISAPVMPISNQSGEGWSNTPSATLFFNPYAREISSLSQRKRLTNEIRRYMYIAANNADFSRYVTYRRAVRALPCNINISLAEPITLEDNKIERTDGVMFTHLIYSLAFVQNGITSYYKGNGAWSSSHNVLSTQNYENPLSIPVAFNKIAGGGTLELNIIAIVYASKSAGVSGVGLYASIQNVEFATSSPALSKNIVKTIYDENNNVIVEKSPVLAPALDEVFLPGFIKNGIYVKTDGLYYPAKTWSWNGNGEQQLAVYKHLQFLTFVSKPNNLISGKVIGVSLSKIRSIWMFEGNEHLLISGRFNFLTNNIDNAVLHEFTRYEDMWGELADTASLPEVVTTEQTTPASSGARSEAGNVNSTTVYIGSQGGGGGSSTLAGLDDVNISDILPSSLLVYNGTKWVDATIDTILAPYTLKTDHNALAARVKTNEGAISGINTTLASLDTRVGTNYTAITSLANKVNPIDTWFNEVGKYFKKDSDGVWYVDGSFYTKGQNAAGAVGSPDGGGSSGSGVMLLESWSDVPSSLSGYALSAALGIDLHERFNNYYTIGDIDNRLSGINSRLATLDSGMADRYTKYESDGRYLKSSGGTLTGGLTISSGNLIVSSGGGDTVTNKLYPTADNTHSLGQNGRRWSDIKTVLINGGTPIHSGNVGDYALKVDGSNGMGVSAYIQWTTSEYTEDYSAYGEGFRILKSNVSSGNYRGGIHVGARYGWQLTREAGSGVMQVRFNEAGESTWKSWKTIAFTDSNVASATKLQTARTIWGQPFDGTGDVAAQLKFNANDAALSAWKKDGSSTSIFLQVNPDRHLLVGQGIARENGGLYLYGNDIRMCYGNAGSSSNTAMLINASGNVTIGSSDLAGTNTKLYVDGKLRTQYINLEGGNEINCFLDNGDSAPVCLNWSSRGNILLGIGGGYVGIGITSPAYKLDVNGNIGTSGEVFLNHNKAIRMKGSNGTDYNVLFTSGTDLNIGYDSPVIRFGGSKMLINSSGNVGIGTTDPKYTLDVNGQLSTPYYLSFRNASDSEFSYIGRGGSAATLTIMTYGAGNPLQLCTNSQTRMYINGDGNVTIGGSDLAGTSYALCVNGVNKFYDKDNTLKLYTRIKGCGVQIGRTTSAYTGGYNGGVTIGEDDSNLGFIAGAYNESTGSSKILFHYGGTNQNDASIYIKGISGSVGIRTSNPAYLLEVNGTFGVASTSTFSGLTTHNSGISTTHITIGGITLSVVDGALKIDGNVFATGQLATGEAGQATSGGGSVQYWSNEYDMENDMDIIVSAKEYIGTNTIVGWDSAGTCMSDLYIGFDGHTIWMQGSVDEASDMRLKTVIDAVNLDIRDIAYAPIFNYVFKSRPQGRQMLGSSAQYWQAIAPKAVSENDKGNLAMNYGAIALASVVAVAKKTLTHEEEIANLKLEVQDLKQRLAKYELN